MKLKLLEKKTPKESEDGNNLDNTSPALNVSASTFVQALI